MAQQPKTRRAAIGTSAVLWSAILLVLVLVVPAHSQSLGEIARQERERKESQPHHAAHVYDNDDLKKPNILVPEDRERVQAEKKKAVPPAQTPAEAPENAAKITSPAPAVTSVPADAARHESVPESAPVRTVTLESIPVGKAPVRTIPNGSIPAAPTLSLQPFLGTPTMAAPVPAPTPTRTSPRRTEAPLPAHLDFPLVTSSVKEARQEEIARVQKVSADGRIRIQAGDSLWKLAAEYLGRGTDWLILAVHNPQVKNPMRLQVGQWIQLPEKRVVAQSSGNVRIQSGDSLWKLAQAHLGNGNAWKCVADANLQLQNSRFIFPGQVVEIPKSCSSVSLSRARSIERFKSAVQTSAQFSSQAR